MEPAITSALQPAINRAKMRYAASTLRKIAEECEAQGVAHVSPAVLRDIAARIDFPIKALTTVLLVVVCLGPVHTTTSNHPKETDLPAYRVELEISSVHTYFIDDEPDDPLDAADAAERAVECFQHGDAAEDAGWPDVEIQRIVRVSDDRAIRLLRILAGFGSDTRWEYIATCDTTNKDLARGSDRISVIRRAMEASDGD